MSRGAARRSRWASEGSGDKNRSTTWYRGSHKLCWSLLLLVLLSAGACRPEVDEGRAQEERAALLRAIAQLREAENSQKAVWLQRLRAVPCVSLCELQKTCVQAYERHVQAWSLLETLRERVHELDQESVFERLDHAEQQLAQALKETELCVQLEHDKR